MSEGALGDSAQCLQAVEGGEGFGGGERTGDCDLARHRMNGIRRGHQQVADDEIPLGDRIPPLRAALFDERDRCRS